MEYCYYFIACNSILPCTGSQVSGLKSKVLTLPKGGEIMQEDFYYEY